MFCLYCVGTHLCVCVCVFKAYENLQYKHLHLSLGLDPLFSRYHSHSFHGLFSHFGEAPPSVASWKNVPRRWNFWQDAYLKMTLVLILRIIGWKSFPLSSNAVLHFPLTPVLCWDILCSLLPSSSCWASLCPGALTFYEELPWYRCTFSNCAGHALGISSLKIHVLKF